MQRCRITRQAPMKSKTLKELRSLAKKSGVAGYSRLTKDALVRKLSRAQGPAAKTVAPAKPLAAKSAKAPRVRAAAAPTLAPVWAEPPRQLEGNGAPALQEQYVERAKYALRSNGTSPQAPADLLEDIDQLPHLSEPMLCLLPQKPGVLHAYWVLPEGGVVHDGFKLRLGRLSGASAFEIYEEIALPAMRGSWYFHVPEALGNHEAVVQLGYERDGKFVSTMVRGVMSPPTRYASGRTDPAWWVSEEDFRQLYLRAGGIAAGKRRYGWSAFGSSPGAAASDTGESRPAWPGNTSSSPSK
jgi:hypothetical protein